MLVVHQIFWGKVGFKLITSFSQKFSLKNLVNNQHAKFDGFVTSGVWVGRLGGVFVSPAVYNALVEQLRQNKINTSSIQKGEIQTYKIGLNFVDTNLNYETFLENNKCWCCGHLYSVYILLGHPVYVIYNTTISSEKFLGSAKPCLPLSGYGPEFVFRTVFLTKFEAQSTDFLMNHFTIGTWNLLRNLTGIKCTKWNHHQLTVTN